LYGFNLYYYLKKENQLTLFIKFILYVKIYSFDFLSVKSIQLKNKNKNK